MIEAALARARRSRGALSRLEARLGLGSPVEIPLEIDVDPAKADTLLLRVSRLTSRAATPAAVEARGRTLVVTPSRPGFALDRERLRLELGRLPPLLAVPGRDIAPAIHEPAALAAKTRAERLLREAPAVTYEQTRVRLTRELLLRALRFESRGRRLEVSLEAGVLELALRPLRAYERRPRDAELSVRDTRVEVVPAIDGRRLSVERVAAALVRKPGVRDVPALFDTLPPDRTTAEAKAMKIRELVSEFTTPYPCCPPRVTNIQRAAEILDGTIIPAGGTFSLNEALGKRTRERGFVAAPMIQRGRLVDAVGGGVSQVATTFYNAAFFAGLALVAHTPHQFYISRYPRGREATVSWGGPELVFRNDWPAAILVKVRADSTSITVRFYSSRLGRRVETETEEPHSYRPAKVRTIVNRSLPPGSRRIVQQGGAAGFSVSYTRKVFRGKRLVRNERFFVTYDSEDTFVEIGRPPPPKKKLPGGRGAPTDESRAKPGPSSAAERKNG